MVVAWNEVFAQLVMSGVPVQPGEAINSKDAALIKQYRMNLDKLARVRAGKHAVQNQGITSFLQPAAPARAPGPAATTAARAAAPARAAEPAARAAGPAASTAPRTATPAVRAPQYSCKKCAYFGGVLLLKNAGGLKHNCPFKHLQPTVGKLAWDKNNAQFFLGQGSAAIPEGEKAALLAKLEQLVKHLQ